MHEPPRWCGIRTRSDAVPSGVAGRVLGGKDFTESTLSLASFTAGQIAGIALDASEQVGDTLVGGRADLWVGGALGPVLPGAVRGPVVYPSQPNLDGVAPVYET